MSGPTQPSGTRLKTVTLEKAAAIVGYGFINPALLAEALTHRSAVNGRARGAPPRQPGSVPSAMIGGVPPVMVGGVPPAMVVGVPPVMGGGVPPRGLGSNERLEFIGDRVLGLIIAEWLAERFPNEQEGDLGRRLGHLVAQPVLAEVATTIGLAAALDVSPGEAKAGVRKLATVLADAIEAVIGAIYLDGGIPPVRDFIRRAWSEAMAAHPAPPKDAKTMLQEWAQARSLPLPAYRLTAQTGPSHNPVFTIEVTVANQTGKGIAGAKRAAEQLAATDLLKKIGK